MGAVYKKEMRSYFTSPLAYSVLGIFYFFCGMFFTLIFSYGYTTPTLMFNQMFIIVLFIIPILTMRLLSEDKRQKTDQLLLTAPTRLSGVVMGKFFAAVTVFAMAMIMFLITQAVTSFFATVDWILFISNALGMLLLAGALIAIGLFISSLTESQLVAAVVGFAVSLLLYMMDSLAASLNINIITKLVSWISFYERYSSFTQGTLSYADIIFFGSVAAFFLFLTVRVLDKKRLA